MTETAPPPSRAAALKRHRAGDLAGAEAQYRVMLQATPDDPDLLGLMGVVALQKGDHAAAEGRLRAALAAGGAATVRLRNLNSLIVLLLEAGRRDDAAALAAAGVPAPPGAGWRPDAGEAGAVLSLAEALIGLGEPAAALGLAEALEQAGIVEPRLAALIGRARFDSGDAAGAVAAFERACAAEPDNPDLALALVAARQAAGQRTVARAGLAELVQARPGHAAPAQAGQRACILVVSQAPVVWSGIAAPVSALHFRENYIAQAAQALAGRYRFASVLALPGGGGLPPDLPRPDLVFNNVPPDEGTPGAPKPPVLQALADAPGVPVLNHPSGSVGLTRAGIAARLTGCPGIRVPSVLRLAGEAAHAAAFGRFPADAPFPAVLRRPWTHSSSGAAVAGEDLSAFLARKPADASAWIGHERVGDLYMIEYADLARPGGVWRRLRAMVTGDEIHLHSAAYYDHWLVGGWRIGRHAERFYDAHPECIAEGAAIVADPEAALGRDVIEALRRLRGRIPLDMFGIDFDVDAEGRVVVFEATAAMIFLPMGPIPERLLPLAMTPDAVNAAFVRLVEARLARA